MASYPSPAHTIIARLMLDAPGNTLLRNPTIIWLGLLPVASLPVFATEQTNPSDAPPVVLSVKDFGAVGDGQSDDGPAIQRTIDAAVAMARDAEVTLESGRTYRLGARPNHAAALVIRRAEGLTFSGHGATLLAHPSNGVVSVYDSRRVTVRDFTIDHEPLPFTQARLIEIMPDRGTVRLTVEPGYDEPIVGGSDHYPNFKNSDAVFLDGETRAFTHQWRRISELQPIGTRTYEARFHEAGIDTPFGPLKAGDFIVIKRLFPGGQPDRDSTGRCFGVPWANVYITFSHDIRIERVTSYAAPSMTFVSSAAEEIVLDGCRVVRKPRTDRLIAGNSDGAHFKSLTVMPRIHNCVFEALMDDSVNIRVSPEVVREIHGARVRLAHDDNFTDDLLIKPGQRLTFNRQTDNRYLGVATVSHVERIRYREAWVTLEAPIADLEVGDAAFLQPRTQAVIHHCEFRSQLKTGVLACPPTAVEDCHFSGVAYGIHAPYLSKVQGPPPHALRVKRCEFVHPAIAAFALYLPSVDAAPAVRQALLAQQCQIMIAGRACRALEAVNQKGIVLRDVSIVAEDGRAHRDVLYLPGCTEVHEEDVNITSRR